MSPRRRLPALALIVALVFVLFGLASPAYGERVSAGRVDAVVGVEGGGAAILRDGAALFVDGDGRVRGRCGGDAAPDARAAPRARLDPTDAEDTLRLAGLPDDDDSSPEAEDALEDEGLAPRRRARAAPPPDITLAHALAAAPGGALVWIATSQGLLRARADGSACERQALDGRDVSLVAAGAATVVAVADDILWRSTNGGDSFDVAAALPSRARALAVSASGARALVATDDGVLLVVGPRAVERVLDRAATALAACGEALLALADDGTYAWAAASGATRVGPRPPARSLACASAGAPGPHTSPRWVAAGAGLWTSDDGASWIEDAAGVSLGLAGAAPAASGWWLAADDGLLLTRPGAGAGTLRSPPLVPALTGARRFRAPTAWTASLPRVSVAYGARQETGARSEWHVWLLVTLPLGRSPRWVADLVETRARLVARQAALAAEEPRLLAAPPDDEEAAALARALADERGAVP